MHIFLTTQHKLRDGWWVIIFFLILASLLFPLVLFSNLKGFEITLWHQLLIILIASIASQLMYNKRMNDLAGKINLIWLKELCLGMAMGGSLMIIPALLLTLFGTIQWSILDWSSSTIITGIITCALVAIIEELLFRGFIFQRLLTSIGSWLAQISIAGLFLLTHMNNAGMTGTVKIFASVNIFIASIMFGMAFIKTKRLALPIGLHFMANFIQGTILGFGVSGEKNNALFEPTLISDKVWLTGGAFGLEASLVGLVCVIMLTCVLYFWNSKHTLN